MPCAASRSTSPTSSSVTTTASPRSAPGRAARIFATLPTDEILRLMLEPESIREAVAQWPWCREGWWGKTLATVEVVLADADAVVVTELLDEAHARAGAR